MAYQKNQRKLHNSTKGYNKEISKYTLEEWSLIYWIIDSGVGTICIGMESFEKPHLV